jgi:hypothetical protein
VTIIDDGPVDQVRGILIEKARKGLLDLTKALDFKEASAYTTSTNVGYRPLRISTQLTRDIISPGKLAWHLSVCFVDEQKSQPWDAATGEAFVRVIFGDRRSEVKDLGTMSAVGDARGIHHYMLFVDDWGEF